MNAMPAVKTIALALAIGVVANPAPVAATSVIGSTEPTQIANNIELVAQYIKQIQQYQTQIQQYQAQLKSLRQLDASKLEAMLKGMGGSTNAQSLERTYRETVAMNGRLQSLASNMEKLYREGKVAVDVIGQLRAMGKNISGGDYIGMMKKLGELQQEEYGERIKTINRAAEDARSDIKRVQQIAEQSKDIQTHVEGLQGLMQTNAIMSGQLGGIQQALTHQAVMQTETAKLYAKEFNDKELKKKREERWAESSLAPGSAKPQGK